MDIILLLFGAYMLSGIFGGHKRKPKRHHRNKLWYDSSYSDNDNYRW